MKPFAELLDRLLYAPQRNAKLALMGAYFRDVPDPDRGGGLAALAGSRALRHATPGLVRELVAGRSATPQRDLRDHLTRDGVRQCFCPGCEHCWDLPRAAPGRGPSLSDTQRS